jgi:hypothetical protein
MRGPPGLFDVGERLTRLTDLGDPLLAFAKVVDFEMVRPELLRALAYSDGAQGGRPPFDPVMIKSALRRRLSAFAGLALALMLLVTASTGVILSF